ncbi:MAG: EAL domain-containing protein [Burkholderiaceae bacterium]
MAFSHGDGIQVALDDSGTGYCLLTYLKQFDIGYLKINRNFIRDMEQNECSEAIVRTSGRGVPEQRGARRRVACQSHPDECRRRNHPQPVRLAGATVSLWLTGDRQQPAPQFPACVISAPVVR